MFDFGGSIIKLHVTILSVGFGCSFIIVIDGDPIELRCSEIFCGVAMVSPAETSDPCGVSAGHDLSHRHHECCLDESTFCMRTFVHYMHITHITHITDITHILFCI